MTFALSQSFCKGKFCLAARVDESITQFAANELLFCKAWLVLFGVNLVFLSVRKCMLLN